MTPKHGTGLWYMEMTHESYFRISWRCLHKSNRLGDLGEVRLLPTQFGKSPSEEDTLLPVDGGKRPQSMAVSC